MPQWLDISSCSMQVAHNNQANTQTQIQTLRPTDTETLKHTDTQAHRHTGTETQRHRDVITDIETQRLRRTHTHTHEPTGSANCDDQRATALFNTSSDFLNCKMNKL